MKSCSVLLLFALASLPTAIGSPARADTGEAQKRAALAGIRRLAIVPAFFVTRPRKSAATAPSKAEQQYTATLQQLQAHADKRLPARAADRLPYSIVPPSDVARALAALRLQPADLVQDSGKMKGNRYPLPNPDAVRRLAGRLHVDAVLITEMDEPRRENGHYFWSFPEGAGYDPSHVEFNGAFTVALADGAEVLQYRGSVEHPLTRVDRRTFLAVDWSEAEDLLVEDMLDEVTRYTPSQPLPAGG